MLIHLACGLEIRWLLWSRNSTTAHSGDESLLSCCEVAPCMMKQNPQLNWKHTCRIRTFSNTMVTDIVYQRFMNRGKSVCSRQRIFRIAGRKSQLSYMTLLQSIQHYSGMTVGGGCFVRIKMSDRIRNCTPGMRQICLDHGLLTRPTR